MFSVTVTGTLCSSSRDNRPKASFATTAAAYREFLKQGGLDARIRAELAALDVDDVTKLAAVRIAVVHLP